MAEPAVLHGKMTAALNGRENMAGDRCRIVEGLCLGFFIDKYTGEHSCRNRMAEPFYHVKLYYGDTKMRMSVITVCYNSEATIRRTIESVLSQTSSDFEYLAVDGASTDRTLSILKEYRDRFEKRAIPYRICSGRDRGIYDAMDKGIAKSRGDIIGMVNSDDWYEPDAVETVLKIKDRNDFDICMCSMNLWHGGRKRVKTPRIRKFRTSRDFCHPSMFVTRKTYEKIGLYNRKLFYADFDFWLRALEQDAEIVLSSTVVTNYVTGGVSSRKSFSGMLMRMKERFKVYRRSGYSRIYWIECVYMEAAKMLLA